MKLDKKETKFCKHCGEKILKEAVICVHCGLQVEELKQTEKIIINNSRINPHMRAEKNKWVAFLLCVFLGFFGAHKFYEGRFLLGIVYLFTAGLFGIGWFIDILVLLFKPNPYYV